MLGQMWLPCWGKSPSRAHSDLLPAGLSVHAGALTSFVRDHAIVIGMECCMLDL